MLIRRMSVLWLCLVFGGLLVGCEERTEIPKDEPQREIVPPSDPSYVANVSGGASVKVPNMFLVVQTAGGTGAISLASRESGPTGARMIFGTVQPPENLARLEGLELDFGGGSILDIRSNGLFTATEAYQPKLARFVIEKADANVVSGKMTGEFYKFLVAKPSSAPEVVELEITFRAGLWRR